MQATIKKQTLSDGSQVYDVVLRDGEQAVHLHATGDREAYELLRDLVLLVERKTTDIVDVMID